MSCPILSIPFGLQPTPLPQTQEKHVQWIASLTASSLFVKSGSQLYRKFSTVTTKMRCRICPARYPFRHSMYYIYSTYYKVYRKLSEVIYISFGQFWVKFMTKQDVFSSFYDVLRLDWISLILSSALKNTPHPTPPTSDFVKSMEKSNHHFKNKTPPCGSLCAQELIYEMDNRLFWEDYFHLIVWNIMLVFMSGAQEGRLLHAQF